MLRQVLHRFRCLWHRRRKDAELDDEIRFHLAAEAEERIDAGLAPEQAHAEAQRDFGNVLLTRELSREAWGWAPAECLLRDIGSAFRMMRRNTGYTCAVVLTMALGIGLNAPMYEMLSRLFLQAPPHIVDPDTVHRLWVRERDDSENRGSFTGPAIARDRMQWPEFSALTAGNAHVDAVAGYTAPRFTPNGRGQTAENLRVSWITGEFLDLLGVEPVAGRLIGPVDDDLAATPVAVVSDGYQRERFTNPREALGATLEFDDVTYVVVGVLPPGFSGPDPNRADVWLPLEPAVTASRGEYWRRFGSGFSLRPLVRLPPGLTVEAAGAAATAAVRVARADSPSGGSLDPEATVVLGSILRMRGPSPLPGEIRLTLVVGGVTLLVLLIATVNMSNLLLVRVAARRRELAVRYALGAGRWGVGRLLAIESLVLATVSGAAALTVTAAAGRTLRLMLLPGHQQTADALNVTAIGFTGIAVLAIGLCAAIAPAVYAARSRQIERLDSSRGASALGTPVRTGLIVVQAALSLVLLCGTAVFYRSFEAARQVDVGYAKENLLTVELGDFGGSPLDESTVGAMEVRVRNLPGVRDVAQGTNTPMGSAAAGGGLRVEGHDRPPFRYGPYVNLTSTNFFEVTGLEVLEGRGFNEWDRADTQNVAVINMTFAQQAWPSRSPVGRCLFVGSEATDCTTVVGVVESALEWGLLATDSHPVYFLPISQATSTTPLSMFAANQRVLIVRTRDHPGTVVAPVLSILADLFPELPRHTVQSLPAIFASQIETWRIGTRLFGASAALAVLLAAIGLYAVIAFGVRQRELEFGIRRALGAQASRLLRMVLTRGFSLAAAGIVAGTLAALWAGRFVEPLLFDGRTPRDPLAFAAAALVLLTIAVMASFLPARRASRADPRQALEAE
ncbi:MAG: FtsX-like permease family protein [Holophagales bacterium]|nr:FtsX-like permease family protein [Holophagales bacterium]MYF96631.1 FtsX-like permease family protein [Holophagales bacterium]